MIRKLIIVVLTLAAVGTGLLWALSYVNSPPYWHVRFARLNLRVGHQRYTPTYGHWSLMHMVGRSYKYQQIVLSPGCLHSTVSYPVPPGEIPPERWYEWRGYYFHFDTRGVWLTGHATVSFDLPLFGPFALFAAYPAIAFIRGPVGRWRRRRRGLCIKCGYDLTGNVSGVYPECGTEVPPP